MLAGHIVARALAYRHPQCVSARSRVVSAGPSRTLCRIPSDETTLSSSGGEVDDEAAQAEDVEDGVVVKAVADKVSIAKASAKSRFCGSLSRKYAVAVSKASFHSLCPESSTRILERSSPTMVSRSMDSLLTFFAQASAR